jgi:proline racemase
MSVVGWVHTVDVHAEGEPRVLLGSHLQVKGATAAERLAYCQTHLEPLRKMLLREPRGYPGMNGVVVPPPAHPEADIGLIVSEQGGFRPMSGSNLICAITALIETHAIPVTAPATTLVVDTAVGLVTVHAEVHGGKAVRVGFTNVPAYVVALDHVLELPTSGSVPVDVVFGGQFFVEVRAADLGLELKSDSARSLCRAGAVLRTVAQRDLSVAHPVNPDINSVATVMITGPSDTPGIEYRNTVVHPDGSVDLDDDQTSTGTMDRSQGSTGTCGGWLPYTRAACSTTAPRSCTKASSARPSSAASPSPNRSARIRPSCRPSAGGLDHRHRAVPA